MSLYFYKKVSCALKVQIFESDIFFKSMGIALDYL